MIHLNGIESSIHAVTNVRVTARLIDSASGSIPVDLVFASADGR